MNSFNNGIAEFNKTHNGHQLRSGFSLVDRCWHLSSGISWLVFIEKKTPCCHGKPVALFALYGTVNRLCLCSLCHGRTLLYGLFTTKPSRILGVSWRTSHSTTSRFREILHWISKEQWGLKANYLIFTNKPLSAFQLQFYDEWCST